MKLFISWSGSRSLMLAKALRDWLPNVVHSLEPWLSSDDLEKGRRWSHEIADELSKSNAGIICVTPENMESPWLHFEAGALSKSVNNSFVCPYLLALNKADLVGPLAGFQATSSEKNDTLKLLQTINNANKIDGLPEERLSLSFFKWWPDLDKQLERIRNIEQPEEISSIRPDRELLEEILTTVRELKRRDLKEEEMKVGSREMANRLSKLRQKPRFGIT